MAKIIDFKTRQVLADLPTQLTTRKTRVYGVQFENKRTNVAIIANNEFDAQVILSKIGNKIKKDKAA